MPVCFHLKAYFFPKFLFHQYALMYISPLINLITRQDPVMQHKVSLSKSEISLGKEGMAILTYQRAASDKRK